MGFIYGGVTRDMAVCLMVMMIWRCEPRYGGMSYGFDGDLQGISI